MPATSQLLRYMNRAFAVNVSCVEGAGGFEKNHLHLFRRDRPVLDAARNNQKLSLAKLNTPVTKLHDKASTMNQKHFVLVFVLVPDKFTLKLHELDVLAVERAGYSRRPVLGEGSERINKIGFHRRRMMPSHCSRSSRADRSKIRPRSWSNKEPAGEVVADLFPRVQHFACAMCR